MFFDVKRVHPLFLAAVEKSYGLKRAVSYYRTRFGQIIRIHAHPNHKKPNLLIMLDQSRGSLVQEYALFQDGSCDLAIKTEIISITGGAVHQLTKKEHYEWERVSAKGIHGNWTWLKNQLDTIQSWLELEDTVRVNPYNNDEILKEEMEEVDISISEQIGQIVNCFARLEGKKFGPGIISLD
jgi:hypothetical protein